MRKSSSWHLQTTILKVTCFLACVFAVSAPVVHAQTANGTVIVRTTFQATPAQEPTPPYGTASSPWPRVAVYLNNGFNYDGLQDYGDCTQLQPNYPNPTFPEPSCGRPNIYREKLLEEFEVSAATFSKDLVVPTANLTFLPYTNDTNTRYTKLSYVFHNDYWNPGLNLDRGVTITKIEILEGGTNRVIKTLIPADTTKYINGTGVPKIGMYINGGVVSFAGVSDTTQNGMIKAFDTLEKAPPVVTDTGWFMGREGAFNLIFSDLSTALQCGGTNVGDLDNDKDVDIFDYNKMVGDFGKAGAKCFTPADIDGDGDVDIFDYNKLVGAFGRNYS